MSFADYKRDLLDDTSDVNYMLDRYFHSGESVVFHGAPPDEQAELKSAVATELFRALSVRIHPFQLVICGSAHLGFSPVPSKLGKPFDARTSDIDFAVVSPELFEAWWTELQTAGLDEATREIVSRDLFFGFINPANVQNAGRIGAAWWNTFGTLRTDRARGVRGRLYKSFWSMQSYHRLAVVYARADLRRAAEPVNQGVG